MDLCNNKQKALLELVELLNKGIDLLANNSLDEDLYNAFEKYFQSTIKLVDAAYMTNYEFSFSNNNPFLSYQYSPFFKHNDISSTLYPLSNYMDNRYSGIFDNSLKNFGINNAKDYKSELKILLHRLTTILKILIKE